MLTEVITSARAGAGDPLPCVRGLGSRSGGGLVRISVLAHNMVRGLRESVQRKLDARDGLLIRDHVAISNHTSLLARLSLRPTPQRVASASTMTNPLPDA